ncbi:MAG: STAS domain-containing protein [Chitinophagia bacterium]|nr:STAS domain-containing protein [Chitinophagia bacterium]
MLDNCISVKLTNNLTVSTVQTLRDSLLSRIKNNQIKKVVVDLSEVENCDTSGIVLLIDVQKQCQRYSKDLQLINTPQKISDLADFYEVDKILNKVLHKW